MPYINIDVDLDEFELSDLLDEVKYRYSNNRTTIDKWIKSEFGSSVTQINIKSISIIDQMKIDFLLKNLDKIDLNELEKLA